MGTENKKPGRLAQAMLETAKDMRNMGVLDDTACAKITILPTVKFSGMIDPVSSLEGAGALIGKIYPTIHFLTISRPWARGKKSAMPGWKAGIPMSYAMARRVWRMSLAMHFALSSR